MVTVTVLSSNLTWNSSAHIMQARQVNWYSAASWHRCMNAAPGEEAFLWPWPMCCLACGAHTSATAREGIKKERCDTCLHLFAYYVTVHCFPINFKIKICKLAKAHLKEPSQQWPLAPATCSTLSPVWSVSLSFLYLRRLNKVNMSGYNITDH